ncbi:hypothetical protein AAG906_033839 [Vitis piasezkii]|uniref:Uncharacterized protein n=1 Tax=Vitis vinifera TaxID=29760 RepID=A0A438JZV9_VITVI|nr:hypothetical protein CK203_017214 [Vitis vinifera]|eukprot:XP_019080055.1 PREDICTED: uncharacterized protein LOC100241958 [Vitis vinifera]
MDNKAPGQEGSLELARELLIAISYCTPEKVLSLNCTPADFNVANGVVLTDGDGAEKFRSKLISISYAQSPDSKVLPVD